MPHRRPATLIWLTLSVLLSVSLARAQSQQSTGNPAPPAPSSQPAAQPLLGTIYGTVVDQQGDLVAGAQVMLAHGDKTPDHRALSGEDGQFTFANVAPGPFQLTVTSEGFTAQTVSG